MTHIAVVADDLSGAVETAATFLLRTTRIIVTLDARRQSLLQGSEVHVFDTDSRHVTPSAAAERATAAFGAVADHPVVFKKIDSLLRGHLIPELLAARSVRPNLIVAPALPAAGRTVLGGVVHVNGLPLGETAVWHAEKLPAPVDVAAALGPIDTVLVPLATVRGPGLADALRGSLSSGLAPICDAATDLDLDLIVAAAQGIEQLVLVGSAGLAGALARTIPTVRTGADPAEATVVDAQSPLDVEPADRRAHLSERLLVVVGSAAHGIAGQLESLRAVGPTFVLISAQDLLEPGGIDDLRARVESAEGDIVVVGLDPVSPVAPHHSREIVRRLALGIVHTAGSSAGLVLTGGETARTVLDQLGITDLRPLFQVHHGAVVCAGPNGQLIATRPGSFGDRDSLLSIVRALQQVHTPSKESA